MKRRVLLVTSVFAAIITVMTAVFFFRIDDYSNENMYRRQLVELNKIKKISETIADKNSDDVNELIETVSRYEDMLQDSIQKDENRITKRFTLVIYFFCLLFMTAVFLYIYIAILRPFDKMRSFADKIAKGDFNIPLRYERSNYFGAFTWAFDNMRKEVISARNSEKEAVLKNKTVIATISHDIKTPLASIRAYCEGLEANLDDSIEKRKKYITIITKKCDEVVKLTNDLFLHSVSDLEKLKINLHPESMKQVLTVTLEDNNNEVCRVNLADNIPDSIVMLDRQRFEQVLENLISNSLKYAETDIEVSCKIIDDDYIITVRDYGSGIPAENMPFIFEKFYRGSNAGDKQGSGLGLYITKYIMDNHNGNVKLYNHNDGLEAVLSFPIAEE